MMLPRVGLPDDDGAIRTQTEQPLSFQGVLQKGSDQTAASAACGKSKVPRQRWHSWHCWQCGFCNLQNLKDARETESLSLRQL